MNATTTPPSPTGWDYALRVRELYARTVPEAVAIVEFGARLGLSYADALRVVSLCNGHPVAPALFLFEFAKTHRPDLVFSTGVDREKAVAWARATGQDGQVAHEVSVSEEHARSMGYSEFGRFRDDLWGLLADLAMSGVALAACPLALYGWLTPDEADLKGLPKDIDPLPTAPTRALPRETAAVEPRRALRVVESAPPAEALEETTETPPSTGEEEPRSPQEMAFEQEIRDAVEMSALMGIGARIGITYAKESPEAERLRLLYRNAKERLEASAKAARETPTTQPLPSEVEYDRWLCEINKATDEATIAGVLMSLNAYGIPADNTDASWVRKVAKERTEALRREAERVAREGERALSEIEEAMSGDVVFGVVASLGVRGIPEHSAAAARVRNFAKERAATLGGADDSDADVMAKSGNTLPGIGSDAHYNALLAQIVTTCPDPKTLFREITDAATTGRIVGAQFNDLVSEFEQTFPALAEWARQSSPKPSGYPKRSQRKTAEYPPMAAPALRVLVPTDFDPSTLSARLRGLWQHAAAQFPHKVSEMREWIYRVSVATREEDATAVMADAEIRGVPPEIKTLIGKWFEVQRTKFVP